MTADEMDTTLPTSDVMHTTTDIMTELRDWATITDEVQGKATLVMLSGQVFAEAADEIERLRAAIDSLLADIDTDHRPVWAGGAKATGKQPWCCALCGVTDDEWPCIHRRALDKLKEARRG